MFTVCLIAVIAWYLWSTFCASIRSAARCFKGPPFGMTWLMIILATIACPLIPIVYGEYRWQLWLKRHRRNSCGPTIATRFAWWVLKRSTPRIERD